MGVFRSYMRSSKRFTLIFLLRVAILALVLIYAAKDGGTAQEKSPEERKSTEPSHKDEEKAVRKALRLPPEVPPQQEAERALDSGDLDVMLPHFDISNWRRDMLVYGAKALREYHEDRSPATIEAHFFLPKTDDQFAKVFASEPSMAALVEIKQASARLKDQFGIDHPDDYGSETTIAKIIMNSHATFIMLVGHNQNRKLTFLDGSTISIASLLDMAHESGKKLIIISCQASNIIKYGEPNAAATKADITFDEAIEVAKYVTAHILTKSSLTMGEVAGILREAETHVATRSQVRYTVKVFEQVITVTFGAALLYGAVCTIDADHCGDDTIWSLLQPHRQN